MSNSIKDGNNKNNIMWQLLSVAIAFCLWFVVINTQNPEETRSYTVPVTIANSEMAEMADLTITNYGSISSTKLNVKVRGPRLSLDRLRGNDISAVIDLSKLNFSELPGTVSCSVDVMLPSGVDSVQIEAISKRQMDVVLEGLISETRIIDIKMNGQAAEGFSVVAENITPSDVTISGATSAVKSVVAVRADVDITEQIEDRAATATIYAYDSEGNVVEGVSLSVNEVTAELKAYSSKRVPIEANFVGKMDGFAVERIDCSPAFLMITGKPDVLETVDKIVLPDVDITGRTSNIQDIFHIEDVLPEGIKTADGAERITVDVRIVAEAETSVKVDIEDIQIDGEEEGRNYEIINRDYSLVIKAAEKNLASFDESKVKVIIDVEGLSEGEHFIVPEVVLPESLNGRVNAAPLIVMVR